MPARSPLGFVVTLNTARALLLETRSSWSGLEGLSLTGELANLGALNHLTPGSPFRVRILRAGEMLELPGRMP